MTIPKTVVFKDDDYLLFKFGACAVTINGNIYIKQSAWDDMSPLDREALIIHEQVHLKQQSDSYFWYVKYAASKSFRYSQEFEAYLVELKFLLGKPGVIKKKLIEKYARILSSNTYFGMASYDEAYKDLSKAV